MANFFTKLFSRSKAVDDGAVFDAPERNAALENPSNPINGDTLSGLSSPDGKITVTKDNILSITALWRAITILSGVVASLPIAVYKVTDNSAQKRTTHPITRLLSKNPSRLYTKFDFIQTLVLHLSVCGNFYALIIRNGAGNPTSLAILNPLSIKIETNSRNEVIYTYTETRQDGNAFNTTTKRYNSDRIIHVSGLSWSALLGENVMNLFQDILSTGISYQDFLASFFANSAMLAGAIKVPQKLDDPAYKRMGSSWKNAYGGTKKAGGIAILEQGAEYQKIGLTPDEAGSGTVKNINVSDIALITGVPAFLLEHLDRATYHNVEQLNIAFVLYTVHPLCQNIQEELARKLLQESEIDTHEIRFDLNSLLLADAKTRAERIDRLMKWGIINRDEARSMEGMNPITDGSGQTYYVPLNMVDPNEEGEESQEDSEELNPQPNEQQN